MIETIKKGNDCRFCQRERDSIVLDSCRDHSGKVVFLRIGPKMVKVIDGGNFNRFWHRWDETIVSVRQGPDL